MIILRNIDLFTQLEERYEVHEPNPDKWHFVNPCSLQTV